MKKVPMTLNSDKHEFVNFREVRMAGIAPGRLYRSSHPAVLSETDFILSKLAEEAGIAAVLNLADNETELAIKAERIMWYYRLFKRGCITALGMGFDFLSGRFSSKLQKGFKFMLEHNGPYLIHCFHGIDRTGFMVMLLEMLMGADKDEMTNDYMMSFFGRPDFENGSEHYQNEKNNFSKVLNTIYTTGKTSEEDDLSKAAENYLLKKTGLTSDEITLLKLTLSKNK
ncbi:MAG: tyrosine-protein phosphatase [Treponema sp.]|nr:tyrosine-protein phosphatase [Treponema sp.]